MKRQQTTQPLATLTSSNSNCQRCFSTSSGTKIEHDLKNFKELRFLSSQFLGFYAYSSKNIFYPPECFPVQVELKWVKSENFHWKIPQSRSNKIAKRFDSKYPCTVFFLFILLINCWEHQLSAEKTCFLEFKRNDGNCVKIENYRKANWGRKFWTIMWGTELFPIFLVQSTDFYQTFFNMFFL